MGGFSYNGSACHFLHRFLDNRPETPENSNYDWRDALQNLDQLFTAIYNYGKASFQYLFVILLKGATVHQIRGVSRIFRDKSPYFSLPLKAPNENCSRRQFNFLLLSFGENKT